MDLTNYVEHQKAQKTKVVLTCYVRLDKKSILAALASDRIIIDGKEYKVPEGRLLECLVKRMYGETRLDLEQIESKSPDQN